MKYAGHFVRKGILSKLVGSVDIGDGALPIYGRVPDSTTYPYAIVRTEGLNEIDHNRDSFTSTVTTVIEVVTRYPTDDGGQLVANQYMNEILQLIRTRSSGYMDLASDDFTVYGQEVESIDNVEENYSDYYYYRCVLNLGVKVQEN